MPSPNEDCTKSSMQFKMKGLCIFCLLGSVSKAVSKVTFLFFLVVFFRLLKVEPTVQHTLNPNTVICWVNSMDILVGRKGQTAVPNPESLYPFQQLLHAR